MEIEKRTKESKPESKAAGPTQNISDLVEELVVGGATMLANSAAKAVVGRVKKAAAKSPRVKAVAKAVKKAKKSAVKSKPGRKKAKKSSSKARAKSATRTVRKSAKKKSAKSSRGRGH